MDTVIIDRLYSFHLVHHHKKCKRLIVSRLYKLNIACTLIGERHKTQSAHQSITASQIVWLTFSLIIAVKFQDSCTDIILTIEWHGLFRSDWHNFWYTWLHKGIKNAVGVWRSYFCRNSNHCYFLFNCVFESTREEQLSDIYIYLYWSRALSWNLAEISAINIDHRAFPNFLLLVQSDLRDDENNSFS